MSSLGLAGPDGPGADVARLKPDTKASIYDWADRVDEREEAARIDRLAGDRNLIGELRRHGFNGPEYQRAAEELVRYGMSVVTAWSVTGTIFEKCAKIGRPVQRPPTGALDSVEAESLAGEVITVALTYFRDEVLVPGLWDPARGASLTTYFVGQCIRQFPNIYRSWLAQVPEYELNRDGLLDIKRPSDYGLEDVVLDQRTQIEALRLVRNDDARRAMVLWAWGYTYGEIAERLQKTEKAVERMVDYGRKQVRRGKESA